MPSERSFSGASRKPLKKKKTGSESRGEGPGEAGRRTHKDGRGPDPQPGCWHRRAGRRTSEREIDSASLPSRERWLGQRHCGLCPPGVQPPPAPHRLGPPPACPARRRSVAGRAPRPKGLQAARIHVKTLPHVLEQVGGLLAVREFLVGVHAEAARGAVLQLLPSEIPPLVVVLPLSLHSAPTQRQRRGLQALPSVTEAATTHIRRAQTTAT